LQKRLGSQRPRHKLGLYGDEDTIVRIGLQTSLIDVRTVAYLVRGILTFLL